MIQEIILAGCPILFTHAGFERWHIPHITEKSNCSSPPSGQGAPENEERPGGDNATGDAKDAVLEITDKLKNSSSWWIFEILPVSYAYQNAKGKWATTWW